MDRRAKRDLTAGLALLAGFGAWTALVRRVDVQPIGPNGTSVGLAALNGWFHRRTGVHLALYALTDWLGLVPIAVCLGFAALGAVQLARRRRLSRVDGDILLLGVYYAVVIGFYLLFEMIPINFRPILIDGALEASYPSSTTLLVLSVMPTLGFQAARRSADTRLRRAVAILSAAFSALMVAGRLAAGVHWLSDIVGAALLSAGLFAIYRWAVALADAGGRGRSTEAKTWNSEKNCRRCARADR